MPIHSKNMKIKLHITTIFGQNYAMPSGLATDREMLRINYYGNLRYTLLYAYTIKGVIYGL